CQKRCAREPGRHTCHFDPRLLNRCCNALSLGSGTATGTVSSTAAVRAGASRTACCPRGTPPIATAKTIASSIASTSGARILLRIADRGLWIGDCGGRDAANADEDSECDA